MKIRVEIDTATLRQLVLTYLESKLGYAPFDPGDVKIHVMSKQNYRQQEWEVGEFRAVIEQDIS